MTISYSDPSLPRPRPPLGTAVSRGLSGRCPCCGTGKLFETYLKQVQTCPNCNEEFGHIRSDDAAPWLTILVVGHILVPFILMVEARSTWPMWISFAIWIPAILAMSFAVLPKAKGVFLGMIWATKAPGSEKA